jgi:hypothetical protein
MRIRIGRLLEAEGKGTLEVLCLFFVAVMIIAAVIFVARIVMPTTQWFTP